MKPEFRSCVLLLSLAALSCDEAAISPRAADCQAFCDKLETCDDRTDVQGCERRCAEESIRSDAYLEARVQCVQKTSCNVWQGEVGVMGEDLCADDARCSLNDCTKDVLARSPSSSEDKSYCARLVSKLSACDHSLVPLELEANCLQLIPALSGGYLDEVRECAEVTCDQVRACLDRVDDRFNSEASLFPRLKGEPRR